MNKRWSVVVCLRRWYGYLSLQFAIPKISRSLEFDLNVGSGLGLINLGFDLQLRVTNGIIGISLPFLDVSINYFPN